MRLPIRVVPILLLAVGVCVLPYRSALAQAGSVGAEFRVNTNTTGLQGAPRAASDSAGNFVVVWQSPDQVGAPIPFSGVFGQRYGSTGAPIGTEFRVNTYTSSAQGHASVASDSAGNFVVVWNSYTQDGSKYGIFGQRYSSAGAPLTTEFRISTYTSDQQIGPSVASASNGSFVVVWASFVQVFGNAGIFGRRYSSAGAPLGAEFRINAYTTGGKNVPSVASDSGGNFVVVWDSVGEDGYGYGVFGQRYDSAGTPLGAEFRVNTYTTSGQSAPFVATAPSGNFVVVWASYFQSGDFLDVFGQRYSSAGAPLGAEFRVNTYTQDFQDGQSVVHDSSGNFVVIWESGLQDGSARGVFGQLFTSAGSRLGTEFRVNSYTSNGQYSAAVARVAGGDFVVLWQSDLQDGSDFGIFAQRICSGLPSVTPPPPLTTTQTLCM